MRHLSTSATLPSVLALLAMIGSGCPATAEPDPVLCFHDADGDGYGFLVAFIDADGECGDRSGESTQGGDCDDSTDLAHPGAAEVPDDGFDQDCDGIDSITCRPDGDGDGFGGGETYIDPDGSCEEEGQRPSWDFEDCDDADPGVYPGAEEVADDGVDQDCDGIDPANCLYDGDADGWGAPLEIVSADADCDDEAETEQPGDCDDSADWIHPGAPDDAGDGFDADCDGTDPVECFVDGDADGWGGGTVVVEPDGGCDEAGLSWYGGDCDDSTATFAPLAYDPPGDEIDQDCNGIDAARCYYDGDGDGFGWIGGGYVDTDGVCTDDAFQSYASTDCDDSQAGVHPGMAELPGDGIDQDCDAGTGP